MLLLTPTTNSWTVRGSGKDHVTGHVTCHVHKYSIVSFLILCIILTNGHTNVHIIAKQLPNSIVQCIMVNNGTSQHHCDLLPSNVLG